MSNGIIYVMTTVVTGLIKIGKTSTRNFESRMYQLERNGYANVTGLKRKFAIEVEDYNEKEELLHELFSKSRVENTELFASDVDLVIKLLSSFEGRQVYPVEKTKKEVFDEATKELEDKLDSVLIPDGFYYLERNVRDFGKVKGKARLENGVFTVLKGSICGPITGPRNAPDIRKRAKIEDNILMEDVVCSSPSGAGWLVIGKSNNGWAEWKDEAGRPINIYRKNK